MQEAEAVVPDFRPDNNCRNWHQTTAQCLAEKQHIWRFCAVLAREEFACSTKTCLDFVNNA